MAGAAIGIAGTVYTTLWDVYNVATFGTQSIPDVSRVSNDPEWIPGTPMGSTAAAQRLITDLVVPDCFFNVGANWGTSQRGWDGAFGNGVCYWSRDHDINGNDRLWVNRNVSPVPARIIPTGPIGMAIVHLGIAPFWIRNSQGYALTVPES